MSKKKSYMDKDNILSEGFYTDLLKYVMPIVVLRKGYKQHKVKSLEKNLKKLKSQAANWQKKKEKHDKDQEQAAKRMRAELEKQTGIKLSDKDLKAIDDLIGK